MLKIFTSSMLVSVFVLTISYKISGLNNQEVEKESCIISNVTYPRELPQNMEEINSENNFVSCKCGKNCVSDLGICVRVMVLNTAENMTKTPSLIHVNFNNYFLSPKCTHFQDKCLSQGNGVFDAIRRSETIAEHYIKKMHSQEPIDCYNISGKIVMINQKAVSIMSFITSSIFLGSFMMVMFMIVIF